MRKYLFFLFMAGCLASDAQDFSFSQFYEMPMLRNPALSGIFNGDMHVSSAYRSQWGSISVPYTTAALGIEYKYKSCRNEQSNSYTTFGIQFTYDKAGDLDLKRTQAAVVGTRHQFMGGTTYLSASFMAGIVQSNFDPTAARLDDQFVNGAYAASNLSSQVFTSPSYLYPDFSGGLVVSSAFGEDSHFYFGVAGFHAPVADNPLQFKAVINAGLSTPVNDKDQLIAYGDYSMQAGNKQLFGGLLYEKTLVAYENDEDNIKASLGAFYRWDDAFIPAIKLQVHKMMVGISYDVNVSQLRTASQFRGGLELTLSFLGFLNKECSTRSSTLCPGFGSTSRNGWAH